MWGARSGQVPNVGFLRFLQKTGQAATGPIAAASQRCLRIGIRRCNGSVLRMVRSRHHAIFADVNRTYSARSLSHSPAFVGRTRAASVAVRLGMCPTSRCSSRRANRERIAAAIVPAAKPSRSSTIFAITDNSRRSTGAAVPCFAIRNASPSDSAASTSRAKGRRSSASRRR